MKQLLFIFCFVFLGSSVSFAQITLPNSTNRSPLQEDFSYLRPQEYVIGGVKVTGTEYLDKEVLITISKLNVGNRIEVPGEAISTAIKNLWAQGLFDDVAVNIESVQGENIFFDIVVVERPRLTRIDIMGLSNSQTKDIKERVNESSGKIVNENLLRTTRNTIERYLGEKGYFYPEIKMTQIPDSTEANNQILVVEVDRKNKVKVNNINFEGNTVFSDKKLAKFMKKVKARTWWRFWGPGKFTNEKYEEGKQNLIAKVHDEGYRDARIVSDTVRKVSDKHVEIDIEIYEGPRYYFGDIKWSGNAKYSDTILNTVLGLKKGDVFSEEKLITKLYGPSRSGNEISTLYMNDGYLTFNVDPVQTRIYGDTIDMELRIYEGPQYTVSKVTVKGNDVTNDRVILREIVNKPGQKFSKSLVMQTVQQIAQLGNFDETKTNPVPIPNELEGTVDMQYNVVEKPSDQIELSGGFGGNRIIGTLGLTFNNFSTRRLFEKGAWKPLPRGDGQKLSLRGQTNGKQYQSYSFSFSEPWLGGKKPIYFGLSAFTSSSSYGYNPWTGEQSVPDEDMQRIRMNGFTVSLGKRLKWPDNFFRINYAANIQQYKLQNWRGYLFETGTSYNFNITQEISRNSLDALIYPTSGTNLRFTVQATPPYSIFNNTNYLTASDTEKYRWTEYHKWKFDSQWYQRISGKLVLKAQAQFGFLGTYSSVTGQPAFERFKLGGDGMQGFDFIQGSEIIAMRGYANGYIIPEGSDPRIAQNSGSPIYTKYQLELRHPLMLNDQATVFGMVFAEAGNTWNSFKDFNPFQVRRTLGVGARVYLPIFGMLGIDYGYGFDPIPGVAESQWRQNFTFSIQQNIGGFN
jgi:outer membrane protein insertion porin family